MSAVEAFGEKRATYADVLAAPEHKVAQIIDGHLHLHPRPAPRHAVAASAMGAELGSSFGRGRDGPGGWWILDEPELHLAEDILVPDMAGWRRERMPAIPETAYFELAPDWVCDVLSESTRAIDIGRKRDIFAREGVAHLWFVDPVARTLEAFALTGGRWLLLQTLQDRASVALPPFEAAPFELAVLWGEAP